MSKFAYGDKVRISMMRIYKENDMIEECRYNEFVDTEIIDVIPDGESFKYEVDYKLFDDEPNLVIDEESIVSKINWYGREVQ